VKQRLQFFLFFFSYFDNPTFMGAPGGIPSACGGTFWYSVFFFRALFDLTRLLFGRAALKKI